MTWHVDGISDPGAVPDRHRGVGGGWADAEEEYVEMDHPVLGGADAQECCGLFEVVIQSVRNDK